MFSQWGLWQEAALGRGLKHLGTLRRLNHELGVSGSCVAGSALLQVDIPVLCKARGRLQHTARQATDG